MITPSTKVNNDILQSFYLRMCSIVDSHLSKHCTELVTKGDYKGLLDLCINPNDYVSAAAFADDYLLLSFFSKYPDFNLGVNREKAAFEKWLESEESCRVTNEFMGSWLGGETPYPPRVGTLFEYARRKVAEILGPVSYDAIKNNCRFGPGSDLSTRGASCSTYNKFATSGSCTPWVLPMASDLFAEDFREDFFSQAELVRGNRLAFVPKNAKIDRSIGVEPRWNIFTQLGVGQTISNRLLKFGIDLKDQTRNQRSAQRAQRDGLATIDISRASDSCSKILVLALLPDEWADVLFKLRSPVTSYKGVEIPLQKMSSMGNGYTFPLETLIFYAFAYAAVYSVAGDVSEIQVYGDDIIVPKAAAKVLIELLSYMGFSTNVDKTYLDGVFYESCGQDFWCGVNVRPFFQRRALREVFDIYTLANQLVAYACQETDFADSRWKGLWEWTISQIPRRGRLYGSRGVTGVLHAPFDLCRPARAGNGWEGWRFACWTPVPCKRNGYDFHAHLYTKLLADVDTGNRYDVPRNTVWRRRQAYVHTYREFTWV